jgi:hypothetical protein
LMLWLILCSGGEADAPFLFSFKIQGQRYS